MSILNDTYNDQPITPKALKNYGFFKDVGAYVKVDQMYWIHWYPESFKSGITYPNHQHVDVRQRCTMHKIRFGCHYISPVLKTMEELDMFVQLVFDNKVKPTIYE